MANSESAVKELQNGSDQMDLRSHADLVEMKKSMSQDVEEFWMGWKNLISTIGSIEDTKLQVVVESWKWDTGVENLIIINIAWWESRRVKYSPFDERNVVESSIDLQFIRY